MAKIKDTSKSLSAVEAGLWKYIQKNHSGPRSGKGSISGWIETLCKDVSLNLDEHWKKAQRGEQGFIDVIDMFSGCGGMSTGFKIVNGLAPAFRLIGAFDIDKVANRSYQANLGLEPFTTDISKLATDSRRLSKLLSEMDRREENPLVLIGCAPCQGFSSHRNSDGEDDERNSLFIHFANIAAKIKPDAIIVENVPELLTTRYWKYVKRARAILEGCGYHMNLTVHNMAEFGVPQERFRTLFIGFRKKFRPVSGFLPRDEFRTVRDAIYKLPPVRAGEISASDEMHQSAGHKPSTIDLIRHVPKDGGNRPQNIGPACLLRAKAKSGRAAYEDVYGRLFWDRPAITITAYARNPASGRFVHPEQDRGLTVREAAMLQSFPSNYRFLGGFDERFRQIGNAVPPAFAASLALQVISQLIDAKEAEYSQGLNKPVGPSFSRLIPALKAGHAKGRLEALLG